MQQTYSSSRDPHVSRERPRCPKCNEGMMLAGIAQGPSGFDIGTFDCATCNHAHILSIAIDAVADGRSLDERAIDALETAQAMPPGARRSDALKKAGVLRRTADNMGILFAKRGRRPK